MKEQAEGKSSKNDLLIYTQLELGKPANFALLEEDPATWWSVWGHPVGEGKKKNFRFISKPSKDEIDEELGTDYTHSMDFNGTSLSKPQECLTWPIYNWDLNCIQVLEVSHVSVSRQFATYGLNRRYSKNFLSWDFELTKTVGERTKYSLLIVPRDEDHDDEKMDEAWERAQKEGFDLNNVLLGSGPYKAAD